MRNLHHPIAVFVVAVLIVIGIGVGVLAAQGTPKGTYVVAGCRFSDASVQTYGPPGSRFAAEFPMQPTERHAVPGEFRLMFRVSEPRRGRGYGCIDAVVVEPAHDFPSLAFGTHYSIYDQAHRWHLKVISQRAGTFRVTVWQFQPVHCYAYRCIGTLLAADGPTVWVVGGGDDYAGPVRNFLASFHPIG
jgi:hypothetical protein